MSLHTSVDIRHLTSGLFCVCGYSCARISDSAVVAGPMCVCVCVCDYVHASLCLYCSPLQGPEHSTVRKWPRSQNSAGGAGQLRMGVETRLRSQQLTAVSSCGFPASMTCFIRGSRACYRQAALAALEAAPEDHRWPRPLVREVGALACGRTGRSAPRALGGAGCGLLSCARMHTGGALGHQHSLAAGIGAAGPRMGL